ncbi:MAG: hypothetical protein J5764_00700 [Bacteroidales bacterium]|nr:hypothetical protein [Bacteroidales bacterium]
MKKIFTILVMTAAVLSCSKEVSVDKTTAGLNTIPMSFTVSCQDSKVFMNEDGLSLSFAPGDRISVFADGTNYEFTTEEGGSTAVFSGEAAEAEIYYALYPYSEAATVENGTIKNITVSKSSAGAGTGSFNSQRAVLVAASTSNSLEFKHVMAFLKITVPEEITDLKEIVIFNRDSGSSNTAGALAGTFNVTPSLDGAPEISVTAPEFQTGFVGPDGSENPVPAGVYYIPVLPAQLTIKKGIDLKITFHDEFVGRAFDGHERKLERANVYSLGTLKKTDEFVFDGFESGADISSDDYTGNTGALKVVANPVQTDVNPSNFVLKNDMSGSTNPTSGYIQVKTASTNGYIKFPSSVRANYNKIRVKMYLGTNAYYPRARRGSNPAAHPALLNGVAVTDQASWEANVKTDDWNIMEWNISQIDGGWTNMTNMQTVEFRPFVNWDGNNMDGFDETTNNRLIYIDDITFILK